MKDNKELKCAVSEHDDSFDSANFRPVYEDDVVGMNYCPNCGAKMKGEGNADNSQI